MNTHNTVAAKIQSLVGTLHIETENYQEQFAALLDEKQIQNFAQKIISDEEVKATAISATEVEIAIEDAIYDLQIKFQKEAEEQEAEDWRRSEEIRQSEDADIQWLMRRR